MNVSNQHDIIDQDPEDMVVATSVLDQVIQHRSVTSYQTGIEVWLLRRMRQ